MSKISLKGHVLSVKLDSWAEVLARLSRQKYTQVSIAEMKEDVDEDGNVVPAHFLLSYPLSQDERLSYIHLYKQQKREREVLGDDGGDDDPFFPPPLIA
jgi:hypothetical protein